MPGTEPRRRVLAAVAAGGAVLASSGCLQELRSVVGEDDSGSSPSSGSDSGSGGDDSDSSSASGDDTTEATVNPWQKDRLVVAVDQRVRVDYDFVGRVENALAFWEQHSEQYAGYSIAFDLRPNAGEYDVQVVFARELTECGGNSPACVQGMPRSGTVSGSAEVWVRSGYRQLYTEYLLKHEFGHILQLTHGEEPQWLMSHDTSMSERLPQYDQRLELVQTYKRVVEDHRDGREEWRDGQSYWNARQYEAAVDPFRRARDTFGRAVRSLDDAISTAQGFDEPTGVAVLRKARRKLERLHSAAEKMVTAARESVRENWDSANESLDSAKRDLAAAEELEVPSFSEFYLALGLPPRGSRQG